MKGFPSSKVGKNSIFELCCVQKENVAEQRGMKSETPSYMITLHIYIFFLVSTGCPSWPVN